MRYTLQRYDNVFGTSDVTLVSDDVYFNRETTSYYGSDFNSLDDAISAAVNFIGSDDFLNIWGLHFVNNVNTGLYDKIMPIINRFHMLPYSNIPIDGEYHSVTDIIKIDNKTTVFNDSAMGFESSSGRGGYYRIAHTDAGGFVAAPWCSFTVVTTSTSLTGGSVEVFLQFFAFPSNMIQSGVINADENTPSARVTVQIGGDVNLLGFVTSYDVRVNIFESGYMDRTVYDVLNNLEAPVQNDPNNDPYSGESSTGGASGTGGGHYTETYPPSGTYSPSSDPNPVPGLPAISSADTGFITLFNPTSTQLKNLAQYMWGSLFDITTWKKIFADPMDCILGLSIVPVNVPSSGTDTVKVGNISTGITMNKANSQFVELNCGTISITEYWKAYLDYSPYTKLNIYLPYIGAHELNIDDIQINTVGVIYHIDVLSGACVAYITAGGNVIAQYSGQCSISIPVTAKDFTQTIIALGTLVAGGVTAAATGGLSAPVTASSIGGAATSMATTAANVITSKPSISKSGNMSGSNGLMGVQTPYLFITRPKQCAPKNQNRYSGYPSYITETLGNLTGFTQVQDIRLNNIPCTEAERQKILDLLHEGVIL